MTDGETQGPAFWQAMREALTEADCDRLVREFAPRATLPGGLVQGARHLDVRRCGVAWVADVAENAWIYERVMAIAARFNRDDFRFRLDGIEEELLFLAYRDDIQGFYDWHVDRSAKGLAGRRKLSITLQLSDPQDYEGGGLKLNPAGVEIAAPRLRGCAIAFPSFCLHRVDPVTRGVRYALVAWLHGPDFV